MPTLSSILSNAATGLRAQQAALNVVSHNVANAATPGYARQRVVLSSNPALYTADGAFGTGVSVVDVAQIRDTLLDANFRSESAGASEQQTRTDMLTRVETVLGEPGDSGLSATLDAFLSAWSDLATNPTSDANRTVVRERGSQLVDKMKELSANLDSIRQEVDSRLSLGVDRVNELTDQVARLNQEIVSVEGDGTTAGDLRDARARALDELATLLPVKVTERDDGSVGVATSGINIVDGAYATPLQTGSSGGVTGLEIVGRSGLLPESGGALGGLLGVLNTDLPGAMAALDELAEALVTDVNALHNTGTTPDGRTGLDFFDPTGTTAWTLSLSTEVEASVSAIAAGTPDGSGNYRAGANDVALGIAALRDNALSTLGTTPGEHLRGLVSSIGLAVRSSTDAAEVHQTLADQADVRRQSLSSVSVDEELVQLIQFQSAYQASARMVTAADEMLQTILGI